MTGFDLVEQLVESIELRARTPRDALSQADYERFLSRSIQVLTDMRYYAVSHPKQEHIHLWTELWVGDNYRRYHCRCGATMPRDATVIPPAPGDPTSFVADGSTTAAKTRKHPWPSHPGYDEMGQ